MAGWRQIAYEEDVAALSSDDPIDVDPTEGPGAGAEASKDDHVHKLSAACVTGALGLDGTNKVRIVDDGVVLSMKATGWFTANKGIKEDAGTRALEVDYDDTTIGIVATKLAVKANSITNAKIDNAATDIAFDQVKLTPSAAPAAAVGRIYADSTDHDIKVCVSL